MCRKIKCWGSEAEICVSSWFLPSCDFALSGVLVTDIMEKKQKKTKKKKQKNGKADETDRNSISLETGVIGALWAIGHTQSQGELTQESIPLIQGLTHSCPALVLSGSAGSHSLWPIGLSGSSVHGILQARILERLPCHPPGDLSDPGMNPCLLYCRWILYLLSHHGSQGNKS